MKYDVIIIGGGIVGLATAMKLKEENPALSICILEKEQDVAMHQTGNNSGVIHAGVYYKPGSLKAVNCRKGYQMLLDFCNNNDVKYDLCGKLIVATSGEELPRLDDLYDRAIKNGLEKVQRIPGEAIKEYEPHVTGMAALFVPYTGIVDFRQVAAQYKKVFLNSGGEIFFNNKVVRIDHRNGYSEIITNNSSYNGKLIVNTAGLFADRIARLSNPELDIRIIPFRGEYYELKPHKDHLVNGLIYPVPDPAFPFLGVHFTRKINGGVEAGPNAVFAFKREGYRRSTIFSGDFFESVTWSGFHVVMKKYWRTGLGEYYRSYSKSAFTNALRKLLPSIEQADLKPGGAGVRAQACDRRGGLVDDFLIRESSNQIDILNAPSPAATASLAIGGTIAGQINKRFDKNSHHPVFAK